MMKNNLHRALLFSIIVYLFISVPLSSAEAESEEGGFYRLSAFNHWNPAMLGIKAGPGFSIFGPSFTTSFGNNAFSPQYIGDTFVDGKLLTTDDTDDILSQITHDEVKISGRGEAPLLGVTYGNHSLRFFEFKAAGSAAIPQDIFELLMSGWEENRLYNFNNIDVEGYLYWTTTFSFAKTIFPPRYFDEFAFGANIKYLRGLRYWGLGETRATFLVTDSSIETEGLIERLSSSSGKGIGLDVGIAGWLWLIGSHVELMFGNLTGSIKWTDITVDEARFERHAGINLDSLANNDYWKNFFNDTDTTYQRSSLTTPLPRYFLLTVYKPGVYLGGQGDIYVSVYQGLNDAPGHSTMPKLSVGSELRQLDWLLIRGDISVGGVEGFELGGGIGVDLKGYQCNLGASWQRGVLGGAKGFALTFRNIFTIPKAGMLQRTVKTKKLKPIKVKKEKPKKEAKKKPEEKPEKKPEKKPEPEVRKTVILEGEPVAPTPPAGKIALTMVDLGLSGMDPGQPLSSRAIYPFESDPVYYIEVDKEKYDKFFKDAAVISGTVLVAKRILDIVESKNKKVMGRYTLKKKAPFAKSKSPFYTFVNVSIPSTIQRTKQLIAMGTDLSGKARYEFKGLSARKLPKVIRGVSETISNLKKAQQELEGLVDRFEK